MALNIETFDQSKGGQSFFKAMGHPYIVEKAKTLLTALTSYQKLAIFDPKGYFSAFSELYDTSHLKISGIYIQRYEDFDHFIQQHRTQFIDEISDCHALFIVDFDVSPLLKTIQQFLPSSCIIHSLDEMRLPNEFLTRPLKYLDSLNFATNFAFFRDQGALHTRLTTANYWSGYSKEPASLWCCLIDQSGQSIAQWTQELGLPYASLVIDSRDVRQEFDLKDFCGQLFLHIIGAAGHDIVKYALDIFSEDGETLSCTHDANSWPADLYAGLPAPRDDERVILWIQNSHPLPISENVIGFNYMGQSTPILWSGRIEGYGTQALDIHTLLPEAKWPQQIEIHAGKHFVRPRYEIIQKSARFIAHVNVERTDLQPNPELKKIAPFFGKGFILPAPILPLHLWRSVALPTPMATTQSKLPLALEVYDSQGKKILRQNFQCFTRSDSIAIDVTNLLEEKGISPEGGFGHMEFIYDFQHEEEGDGWLHSLFRYSLREGTHTADTSFGGHIFNTAITYKNQPFSYRGVPPGLSTRLFLRLAPQGWDTHCHLIYAASKVWYPVSETDLQLMSGKGTCIVTKRLQIACNGSLYWRVSDYFSAYELQKAGLDAYIIIRDETCRLFGYHGWIDSKNHFSLDHMFGF